MMRMQDFYESTETRGTVTTRSDSINRCAKDHGKHYYAYWQGFNIPGPTIREFEQRAELRIDYDEREVLAALPPGEGFYVIAVCKTDAHTASHEVAHALFSLDNTYRRKAIDIISSARWGEDLKEALLDRGYHSTVLQDEAHAFIADGIRDIAKFLKVRLGVRDSLRYWWAGVRLRRLRKKHCPWGGDYTHL